MAVCAQPSPRNNPSGGRISQLLTMAEVEICNERIDEVPYVTPLPQLQRRILGLLGLPALIYENPAVWADPIPP